MHIDDLVGITEWFIENQPRNRCYNLCTGKTHDLLTLAKKILSAAGKNLDIFISKEGIGTEYSGDNSQLSGEMGVFPFSNIDDCIKELYNWYLGQKNYIDSYKLLADK